MRNTFDDLQAMSEEQLVVALEVELHSDAESKLPNEDPVAADIARTNAFGWGVDTLEVSPDSVTKETDLISCHVDIELTGDSDEDKPFCGDSISATATVHIRPNNTIEWEDIDSELNE